VGETNVFCDIVLHRAGDTQLLDAAETSKHNGAHAIASRWTFTATGPQPVRSRVESGRTPPTHSRGPAKTPGRLSSKGCCPPEGRASPRSKRRRPSAHNETAGNTNMLSLVVARRPVWLEATSVNAKLGLTFTTTKWMMIIERGHNGLWATNALFNK
jgi:hypothetical protein